MVPSDAREDVPSLAVALKPRGRSHSARAKAGKHRRIDGLEAFHGGADAEAARRRRQQKQQQQQRRRRLRRQQQQQQQQEKHQHQQQSRRRRKQNAADVVLDNRTRIKRRVKYLLMKMRVDQNLLDAYSGEGWNGQSREKIRPEQELQRAEAQILHSKLAIRDAIRELDELGLEGSLHENAFDAEGRVYHEEIFCAKCKSQEALVDNDIILCDGACNRGFHQYCLDPPLPTINIPPGDEGWLCPVCECKMECVEVINAYLSTNFAVEISWKEFFSKEALIAAGGGTQDGADGDFPSSDSEDDDYDPEGLEMLANSGSSEGESSENEGGDNSDSGSDHSREVETSSSDKDDEDPTEPTKLKTLDRVGKRSSSSKEGSGGSRVFVSDDSDVSLVDEFNDGDENSGLRRGGSQAELSVSDEEAMVIGGKRHRKAVDYKRLHDEMFGNMEIDHDLIASEDEDWGPQRRRRRTIPDDPSRPRPPRVRRRRASSRDALNGVDADGRPLNGEGAADNPGEARGKRAWRRLPDSAVEALRVVVALNTLPSKSRKEELATQLGLSFAQVHGWFKNQRHRALRKGLVSSKRPDLVASSSMGVNAVHGAKTPESKQQQQQKHQVAATEKTMFLNENYSIAEKLDEVQLRLLGIKQTLLGFARSANVEDDDDDDKSGEVDNNNFGNGGIGLPANGGRRRIVYVPVAEVRERPPVSTRTSAC